MIYRTSIFSLFLALALAAPVSIAASTIATPFDAPLVVASASEASQKEEGDDDDEEDEEVEDRSAEKAKPIDPHTATMLALAKKSGCLACHKLERKLVGPGWSDVAQRYKNDSDARTKLIEKVSRGGGGNWTEVTGGKRMPPYGQKVAPENIAALVEFILSLPPP